MKNKKEDWQSGAERRPGSHHKESHVSQRNLEPHLTAPLPPRRERTREILASRRKTKATRSASRARSSGSSFALCREGGALKKKADKKRAKQKQANGTKTRNPTAKGRRGVFHDGVATAKTTLQTRVRISRLPSITKSENATVQTKRKTLDDRVAPQC